MKKRLLAMLLSVVMLFTLTAPAFAAALPQEDMDSDFLTLSADVYSSDADATAAAKNVYESLTPTQQQEFLALIEALAYQGDTQLVEFHKAYVDPSYEFAPDGIMPQAAAVAAAADIAGQLQALNLPATVYYGLLAFATSLGVPVGNVVDLVIGLGLAVIIVANWDAISGVWDDIVNIFVNAFGSIVNDAFDYIQGIINGSQKFDTKNIDWNTGDKNHIMRGSGDGHVDGFKKLGFDPKDPNNWPKLLVFLKQTVEYADRTDGPTPVSGGNLIYYFKYFADKGVEICVKIFYPSNGGAASLSDAWPVK